MQKENIHTDLAPDAIGPYVQAVRFGGLIFSSGQGGLDPATGKMVEGGVEAQAKQTMHNLAAVLQAAGSDFDHVIKTNIYLRYIKDFDAVNDVYQGFFHGEFPARTTVATSALPIQALVEIEMVAFENEGRRGKKKRKKKGSASTKKAKNTSKKSKQTKKKTKK